MPITPLHQGDQGDPQLTALRAQVVLEPLRPLVVPETVENSFGDQTLQAICEDVAGDSEAVLQIVESMEPERNVAENEQRPAIAN
jgi:hypothetical protein